jgi:aryl-alcohol dehydrogenase-like predicted oxidoreductase
MRRVELGKTGLEIGRIGFGAMGLSEFYGPPFSDAESLRVLHEAVDLGCNFIDTADGYGRGDNERILGVFLKTARSRVVVATKFGVVREDRGRIDNSASHLRASCEASLRRLGTDVIDLYYLHRRDPAIPIEETVGAMKRLVEEGKVRALGLSEVSRSTLGRAIEVHPIAALQSEYSLASRDPEGEMLSFCARSSVTFVAFCPLSRGLLSGAYRSACDLGKEGDVRRHFPRFAPDALAANVAQLAPLERVAEALGATPAQIALAWLFAQGQGIVPIPGTRTITRLRENAAADRLTLSDPHLRILDDAFRGGAARGPRYDPRALSECDR